MSGRGVKEIVLHEASSFVTARQAKQNQ